MIFEFYDETNGKTLDTIETDDVSYAYEIWRRYIGANKRNKNIIRMYRYKNDSCSDKQ